MSVTGNTDTGDTITTTTTTTEVRTMDAAIGGAIDMEAAVVPNAVGAAPRESLITTAVNFLQNAKVRHTTLMQKQQFLRSKGLTMDEIQIACERAGVFTTDPTVINMGISAQSHSLAVQPRQNAFGRLKEILYSMALVSGMAYAIYQFWKKFVEPFLFGRKKKPVDEALQDIDKKLDTRIDGVNRDLTHLKDIAQQQREQSQRFSREFNNFRSDLETIKGLLLNRKQFALPLNAGSASIPAWQLSSVSAPCHRHQQHVPLDDNEKVREDDAGSGSGSSETEVVTKNSDSSLEIM